MLPNLFLQIQDMLPKAKRPVGPLSEEDAVTPSVRDLMSLASHTTTTISAAASTFSPSAREGITATFTMTNSVVMRRGKSYKSGKLIRSKSAERKRWCWLYNISRDKPTIRYSKRSSNPKSKTLHPNQSKTESFQKIKSLKLPPSLKTCNRSRHWLPFLAVMTPGSRRPKNQTWTMSEAPNSTPTHSKPEINPSIEVNPDHAASVALGSEQYVVSTKRWVTYQGPPGVDVANPSK